MPRLTSTERYVGPAEVLWLQDAMTKGAIPRTVIAEVIGVDPSTVSKILRGTRKLKKAEFAILQHAIGDPEPTPGQRLSKILALPVTQPDKVAQAAGISLTRLDELKTGTGEPARADEIQTFEKLFGLTTSAIAAPTRRDGGRRPGFDRRQDLETSTSREFRDYGASGEGDQVTIFAGLTAAEPGYFLDQLRPIERRHMPAITAIGAFGIRVENELLLPRYEDGEILLVHPHRTPTLGKWTFVQTQTGRLAIGKLVRRQGSQITLMDVSGTIETVIEMIGQLQVSTIIGVLSE